MDYFLKILSLILLSSVKFAFGPSFVYLNEKYDFTFFETNLYAIIGGMLGVSVFLYLSKWILKIYHKLRVVYFHTFKPKQIFAEPMADVEMPLKIRYKYVITPTRQKRIFTPRNRRIVRIWQTYGLMGLAALTPILFSIPIGTFIMARFESNNKRIMMYMLISVICWSLLLTGFFELTHARSIKEIID